MPYTTAQLASLIGGTVIGDSSITLTGFAPAAAARAGDLTFAENDTYFERAEQSAASAVLVDSPFESTKKALIKVPNARIGFAKAMGLFFPEKQFDPGIHASAVIAASAKVDKSAHVGPFCVVGDGVTIGSNVVLQGGNHIGEGTRIG